MGLLGRMVKSGLKLGACGGVVYAAQTGKFLGEAQSTVAAYERLKGQFQRQEYVDLSPVTEMTKEWQAMMPVPDVDIQEQKQNFKRSWNNGVFYTFNGARQLPGYLGAQTRELVAWLNPADEPPVKKSES